MSLENYESGPFSMLPQSSKTVQRNVGVNSVIIYVSGRWADCCWMKPFSVYLSYGNKI